MAYPVRKPPPTTTVRAIRGFVAVPDDVFDAWLNPALAKQFLFATPEGEMTRVEIDPRIGGNFTFVDRRAGEDIEHIGQYLEIDRPHRLVFSFSVPKYSRDVTRVSVDIEKSGMGRGRCELTLTHEGVWEEYADQTREGWSGILDALDAVLKSRV